MFDIEEAVGGRERLLESFESLQLTAADRKRVDALVEWSKVAGRAPLHRGVREVGISLKQFLELFREAVLQPLRLQAELRVARAMPEVIDRTVNDAKAVWQDCAVCKGTGVIPDRACSYCNGAGTVDKKRCIHCRGSGVLPEHVCSHCNGVGAVELKLNMRNRELVFEASGLTGRGREINLAVQTNVGLPDFEDDVASVPGILDVQLENR